MVQYIISRKQQIKEVRLYSISPRKEILTGCATNCSPLRLVRGPPIKEGRKAPRKVTERFNTTVYRLTWTQFSDIWQVALYTYPRAFTQTWTTGGERSQVKSRPWQSNPFTNRRET